MQNTDAGTEQVMEFRRRHNFYYITIIAYVVFLAAYMLVTGTVTSETVEFGFRDPVVYIIGAFILHALVMLCVNVVRDPRIVFTGQGLEFRSRFRSRAFAYGDIQRVVVKYERPKFNDGTFAVVKLKVATRRRGIRIRLSNFERENELLDQFRILAARIAR
jgi:hypothetical protein